MLDNHIGLRYNILASRYNGCQAFCWKGWSFVESIVLTEAVYYILLSLDQPLHGYGIMQNTEHLSQGRIRLAPGTLYGALNTLLDRGWINAVPTVSSGGRKKEYVITALGRAVVLKELERLQELTSNGEKLTGGWKDEA